MRRRDFLEAAGCAALIATAAGPRFAAGQGGSPAATGRLRRAVASEVTSLDPQRPTGSLTTEMAAELYIASVLVVDGGGLLAGVVHIRDLMRAKVI